MRASGVTGAQRAHCIQIWATRSDFGIDVCARALVLPVGTTPGQDGGNVDIAMASPRRW